MVGMFKVIDTLSSYISKYQRPEGMFRLKASSPKKGRVRARCSFHRSPLGLNMPLPNRLNSLSDPELKLRERGDRNNWITDLILFQGREEAAM
jgi:hypothetical protein